MNEHLFHSIADYHLGKLSPQERAAFETALATDPALSLALQEHRTEWEARELLAEQRLRAQIRQAFADQPPEPPSGNWWANNWKWLLPALLLSGITGFFFFQKTPDIPPPAEILLEKPPTQPSADTTTPPQINAPATPRIKAPQISDPFPPPPPPPPPPPEEPVATILQKPEISQLAIAAYEVPDDLGYGTRSYGETDNLALAGEAFLQKNYARVFDLLDTLPEDSAQDALLLRAHARFATKEFEKSVRDFEALQAGGIYSRDAEWFGLLARMATPGATRESWLPVLTAIRQQTGHPHQKNADALWKGL